MKVRSIVSWAAAFACTFCSMDARADSVAGAPEKERAQELASVPTPRKQVVSFDGREPEAPSFGESMLWVPRVVLSPVYVVTEFGIRRPVEGVANFFERYQIRSAVWNVVTFGSNGRFGIVPSAFVDFGVNPSVGFNAWFDNAFVRNNDLRLHFGTWGADWISVAFADNYKMRGGKDFTFAASFTRRPDLPFWGTGARSLSDSRSRYGVLRWDVGPRLRIPIGAQGSFEARADLRVVDFRDETCCDDPKLTEGAKRFGFDVPPAFFRGYGALASSMELALDSRPRRPLPQHGLRFVGSVEQGGDLRSGVQWIRSLASLGGYADLGRNRVLGLKTTISKITSLRSSEEVPFTEWVTLGGSGPMRGFLYGRLVGLSAFVTELEYRWPIWTTLDGAMHVAFGNVFDRNFENMHPRLFRMSSGIGLRTASANADATFEMLLGIGTETFEDNLRVSSFRFVFGSTRGF
ncbi:MAG: BamA/TamA family outer membrane protein [Polyangiaceae bacterium]